MPEINPLLRRLQVLPPEAFEDNTYGGIIQRKRKYHSGAQAFGVEGMGTVSPAVWIVIVLLILMFAPVFFAVLKVMFGKDQ